MNSRDSYGFIDDATPVQTWPTAPGGGPARSPYAHYASTYPSLDSDEHGRRTYRDVPGELRLELLVIFRG
jgi:hypothetical protein